MKGNWRKEPDHKPDPGVIPEKCRQWECSQAIKTDPRLSRLDILVLVYALSEVGARGKNKDQYAVFMSKAGLARALRYAGTEKETPPTINSAWQHAIRFGYFKWDGEPARGHVFRYDCARPRVSLALELGRADVALWEWINADSDRVATVQQVERSLRKSSRDVGAYDPSDGFPASGTRREQEDWVIRYEVAGHSASAAKEWERTGDLTDWLEMQG